MSKYDIAMDITPGNIPAMLMDHIPDDSDVLEFGCATGRMTRYMKEEKHCRVWIVEIEQDAYERASAFAYGGWRGDAEQLGWQEELGGLRFDCILFADVLEHLRDPQKVLRAAKEFLKENGTILISIPNIAHFDVLAKLAQNKFTYTDLGLLDSTHVHFWGEQDLEPFLEQAGLGITLLDGTCAAPCTTEQKLSRETVPPELFSALLRTPLHTVYQFLIAVQTKAWIQKVGIMPINRLRDESQCSAFYWDMGAGYHSDQVEIISAKSYGGQTTVVFQADLPDGCQRVRFDPVEESACMVCDLTTFVDGLRCEAIPLNGIQIGQSILFTNTDPQIEISLPKNSKKLTVKSTIYALQNKDWLSFFTSVFAERSASEQTHTQLQAEKAASERALIQIQTELDLSNHETEHVKTEHNRLATEKVMLEKEHSRLQSEKFTLEHALAQLKEKTVKLEGEHPHLQTEKSSLERAHAQLQMENPKLAEKCAHLRTEKSLLGQAHTQLQTKNAKLEGKYAHLRTEKSSLERAYTQLQTEKATLEAELARLQTDNESLMEQLKLSRQETQIWAARYSLISNSQCWKLTAPIRKVLDGIKRTQPGHLAYQGLRYWYANGFSATLRKVKAYRRRTPTIIQVSSPTQTSVDSFAGLAGKFSSDCGMRVICSKTLVSYDRSPLKTVLLISHELDLTGAPIAMLHLTDCLKNLGYLPVIISPHDGALSKELEQKGIPALVYPQIYSSEIIRQFAGLFDVIFANTIVSAPAVTALYGFSQPIIWWVHEAEASYSEAAVAALPDDLPETVHVYAGGAYAKARLLSHRPSWQVRELLYYVPDFREQLESFALPAGAAGKTVFACVGSMEQRKGQDILVEAIMHMTEAQVHHSYFVFAGRQYYEPNYRSIMELLKRYPDNVQYIEGLSMTDLRRLYCRMDCLICSSRDDPMPIVVTEAMLMAKLIICSENTGSAAILRANHSGFVYEKDDPELLCRCIQQVLTGGKALEAMRTAARQSYEIHFSQETFTYNVKQIFCQALAPAKLLVFNGSVSVVIPTYNAGSNLESLIKQLQRQTNVGHIEIIVVDSGSTDGTAETAEAIGATVIRITQQEFSHSYARNLGASHATGEYLLFMTQDAIPDGEGWVNRLLQPCLRNNVIAVSCREEPRQNCDLLGRVSIWIHSEYMGILTSDRILEMPKEVNYNTLRRNGQLNDVTCLIRRDIFVDFCYRGDYAEDLDLGIRLIQSGYRLALLSKTRVIHSHTRPAYYYLKRCLVDIQTLKRILPDLPLENPSAHKVKSCLITAYGAVVLFVRKLEDHLYIDEDMSSFCVWTKHCANELFQNLQSMEQTQWIELVEAEVPHADQRIRSLIMELLLDDEISYKTDFSIANVEFHFITELLPRYLNATGTPFALGIKQEISVLLMKYFGQMAGNLLGAYQYFRSEEGTLLNRLAEEFGKGV